MSNGMRNMPCASSVAFHIERNARKFPQRTALIDEYGSVTYAELDAKANQLANYLAAQGIRTGDKVALLAKSSIRWVIAFIAILKNRAVCVPLNYRLMEQDIVNSVADAKCSMVLTTAAYRESHLSAVDLPVVYIDE